jgi:hypothetical protein
VTFFHRNHAHVYGFSCSDCHGKEPCAACHYQGAKPVAVVSAAADAMHHKCAACHDIKAPEGCRQCHSQTARTAFSHAEAVGWELGPYHRLLSCASCHPEEQRISRPDRTCNGCHAGWNNENFDHAAVGLVLSEDHQDLECTDCHAGRAFEKKPSCVDCHDDKKFPRDRPGKRVKARVTR